MWESTAGGFATAPRDLVRWAVALFEERALSAPYLDDLVGRSVPASDGKRYGLGVYLYDTPLGPAWGHGGFFPGYRSGLIYFPEQRIAVCVQVNRDFLFDVDALMLEIARRIAQEFSSSARGGAFSGAGSSGSGGGAIPAGAVASGLDSSDSVVGIPIRNAAKPGITT